jgi:hypothetical protein
MPIESGIGPSVAVIALDKGGGRRIRRCLSTKNRRLGLESLISLFRRRKRNLPNKPPVFLPDG